VKTPPRSDLGVGPGCDGHHAPGIAKLWRMFWRNKPKLMSAPEAPADSDAVRSRFDWMILLAQRLARRDRLRRLTAPGLVIEAELCLIEEATAMLRPAEILFVMKNRERLAVSFEPPGATDRFALKKEPPARPS
jgi:hypothetical protein